MYPKSKFTTKKLSKKGVPDGDIQFYMDNVNFLGNLQLLEELPNIEKNDKDFEDWLNENYSDPQKRAGYTTKHYIPSVSLAFTNFKKFYTKREELLKQALKKELM